MKKINYAKKYFLAHLSVFVNSLKLIENYPAIISDPNSLN